MNNISCEKNNEGYVIKFIGHIDSTNAPKIDEYINSKKEELVGKNIIIDAINLEYISSAGLRIILRLLKDHPELKVINVNKDVYEVFEMTGFTEMLTIEKAFRKFSVDGCEIIGQGSNGSVYRIDSDTIIKVYNNVNSLPDIKRETALAHKALILGIPTAIPYDVVKVGEKYGSVFELLNAKSFSQIINDEPNKFDECLNMYVDLLKRIHSTHVKPTDMPNMKTVAQNWLTYLEKYLEPNKYQKLCKLINEVPEVDTMIHGDYHTKNVMLQNNEVLLIDMDTLSYGHPVFEFASMFLAFIGFGELNHENTKSFMGLDHEVAAKFFYESVAMYLNTTDQTIIQDVINKGRIIGYTRIIRRTIKRIGLDNIEGKKMVDHYIKELYELLDKVDTLAF